MSNAAGKIELFDLRNEMMISIDANIVQPGGLSTNQSFMLYDDYDDYDVLCCIL